jgi:hypothetical protein
MNASVLATPELMRCVHAATLAPSLHNSQPWRFRLMGEAVEVYADRHRQLEVLDPDGRELMVSVGAAVFTLRLALRRSCIELRPGQSLPRTTTTGQCAWCTQCWLTDPSSVPAKAPWPRQPTTRSAACADASMSTWAGFPGTTFCSTST